jgi:hypothetical protein
LDDWKDTAHSASDLSDLTENLMISVFSYVLCALPACMRARARRALATLVR